jgi:iron complex transport system ATP-binding protein
MIFILTGPLHSGKTTLLKKSVQKFKDQKVHIDGFLSLAVFKDQERIGYDLFDLNKEDSIPLLRKRGDKTWMKIGPYFFIPSGVEEAQKVLSRAGDSAICVVDEVGPLELTGEGFWPALEQVLFPPATTFLISVREGILDDFLRKLRKTKNRVFDVRDKDVSTRMTEEIIKTI